MRGSRSDEAAARRRRSLSASAIATGAPRAIARLELVQMQRCGRSGDAVDEIGRSFERVHARARDDIQVQRRDIGGDDDSSPACGLRPD